MKDTIAAAATAMTSAGIGIIRISGDDAVGTADRIFCAKAGKSWQIVFPIRFITVILWKGRKLWTRCWCFS